MVQVWGATEVVHDQTSLVAQADLFAVADKDSINLGYPRFKYVGLVELE